MAGKIEAAIFDVDGTLLDTREFIYSAYEYTLSLHNLAVPERSVIALQMGHHLRRCYEIFAPEYDNDLLRSSHVQFQSEHTELIHPYEGLFEMLEELCPRLKIGLVSSRFRSLIPSLEKAGLLKYVEVVVQGDEVTRHKPDPEGLLKALGVLSVEPGHVSMAGDTAEDIGAGKAARVALTIGITHGFGTEEVLRDAESDYIVHALREIPSIILEA